MSFLDFCVFGLGGLLLIILPIASYFGLSTEGLVLVFLGIIAMMIIILIIGNRRKRNRRKGKK